MKTDSVVQNVPFTGRKRSLLDDARRDRESVSSAAPGASLGGDCCVFEEKNGKVSLHVLFALSNEKNSGFFKAGKVFEVSPSYETHFPPLNQHIMSKIRRF